MKYDVCCVWWCMMMYADDDADDDDGDDSGIFVISIGLVPYRGGVKPMFFKTPELGQVHFKFAQS